MLKYVIPFTERIIKDDMERKIQRFPEGRELYEFGADMYAGTIEDMFMMMYDALYGGTDDVPVSRIHEFFDGIMECWSDIPLSMVDQDEYDSPEEMQKDLDSFNVTGLQLQTIVDTAKLFMRE